MAQILKELPKLSAQDRAMVWDKLGEMSVGEVPESFRKGMKDRAEARHVAMEATLREEPPSSGR